MGLIRFDGVSDRFHRYRHQSRLWINRLRVGFGVRERGRFLQIIVPSRYQHRVRYLKYLFAAIGLLSAFIVFQTVWHAFTFGFLVFFVSLLLEKTIFSHSTLFLHALPTFEVDPDKWLGVGFGYARPPGGPVDIPVVGMGVADLDYAKKLEQLFLTWTNGRHDDEDGNLSVSVTVISSGEYVFLCHPSFKRSAAQGTFALAREELRQSSLDDIILEHHGLFVLGKRCRILTGSYFPEFRRRLKHGTPVMFGFFLPPFGNVRLSPDMRPFVVHSFSIKDKGALTRKDFAFDILALFERGGKWQGPPESAPDDGHLH